MAAGLLGCESRRARDLRKGYRTGPRSTQGCRLREGRRATASVGIAAGTARSRPEERPLLPQSMSRGLRTPRTPRLRDAANPSPKPRISITPGGGLGPWRIFSEYSRRHSHRRLEGLLQESRWNGTQGHRGASGRNTSKQLPPKKLWTRISLLASRPASACRITMKRLSSGDTSYWGSLVQLLNSAAENSTSGCADHRASGSGRSWNFITLLVVPLPPSMWNGARVLTVAHKPLPFQPPSGSSTRPSIHLV